MTSPTNRTTATGEPESEARPRLDLSVPKVAAGALASVTTAVVASFFGVTGTLTGAAFGSVVSSVAAAIYATSLQTAGTRIRASRTVVRRSAGGGDPQDPTALPPELTGRSVPLPGETTVLPASELPGGAPGHGGWQQSPYGQTPHGQEPYGQDPYGRWQQTPPSGSRHGSPYAAGGWQNTPEAGWPQGAVPPLPQHRPRRAQPTRPVWQPVAMMAGFVFLVAMGVIFGTELVLGHPISNAQETGTTITRVVGVDSGTKPPSKDKDKPAPTTTTATTSSTESSESPSPSESASGSGEPTGTTDTTTSSSKGDQGGQGGQSGQGGQGGQDQGGQGNGNGQTGQPTATGDGANPPPASPAGSGNAAGGDAGNGGDVRGAGEPTGSPGA